MDGFWRPARYFSAPTGMNEKRLVTENARLRGEIHDLKSEVRRLKIILAELGAES